MLLLPQELVEYIIDFLHDDKNTLVQACLVAKAWVHPARVHLCETVRITGRKLLEPSNLSYLLLLCKYIKVLEFAWPRSTINLSPLLDCFERSELHTLTLWAWELSRETAVQSLSRFPCSFVTTLEILNVAPTSIAPSLLLSSFPNIDYLTISVYPFWHQIRITDVLGNNSDGFIRHIPPPPLRGSFEYRNLAHRETPPDRRSILHTIASLPPQFQTVSLNTTAQSSDDLSFFLRSCSKTAKKISILFAVRKYFLRIPYSPRVYRNVWNP